MPVGFLCVERSQVLYEQHLAAFRCTLVAQEFKAQVAPLLTAKIVSKLHNIQWYQHQAVHKFTLYTYLTKLNSNVVHGSYP